MEMKKIYVTPKCPIRITSELLGGKWKLLILHQLYQKPIRLSTLKKSIPDISEKMLIQELKTLVDSGLVHRKSYPQFPPRVEYSLTELGENVRPLIDEMISFAKVYKEKILNPNSSF